MFCLLKTAARDNTRNKYTNNYDSFYNLANTLIDTEFETNFYQQEINFGVTLSCEIYEEMHLPYYRYVCSIEGFHSFRVYYWVSHASCNPTAWFRLQTNKQTNYHYAQNNNISLKNICIPLKLIITFRFPARFGVYKWTNTYLTACQMPTIQMNLNFGIKSELYTGSLSLVHTEALGRRAKTRFLKKKRNWVHWLVTLIMQPGLSKNKKQFWWFYKLLSILYFV